MLDSQKYYIKNTKQNLKNYKKNIYEIYFTNRVYFCKVIAGFKNENLRSNKELKK